ncbi:Uu.00g121010.m01.CDS01 [Anthostomella pinea]|uniref:Uu.00g121010.m01.CDS01 n=1 Tax=Anthostomella pinea TaxID=933095 RepID=A0AAI8VGY5_9PEZI|nr:Uu.00g121010.m01.CDS01 [Anthostomella pinea]
MSEPEPANGPVESPAGNKAGAPKDRSCPFCGQAFTSSSLGRHLDLYIKEKNPKPPDRVHDVDAIRKMRGTITRRQPRGSLARRDSCNPATPAASTSSRKSPPPDASAGRPSGLPKESHFVVDHPTTPKYPFQPTWEATGVMNDIPARNGDPKTTWDETNTGPESSTAPPHTQPPAQSHTQRAPSRAAQKVQLDTKHKLADAMDTARAAELALRELLGSWRAAKYAHPEFPPLLLPLPSPFALPPVLYYVLIGCNFRQQIDMNSLPFDFDLLSLDFPALTLQCLQAPPTLFSSTPHPTSTSWSINPPAHKQYEALQMYFQDEFQKWRVACAMANTAAAEDLSYPPSNTHFPRNVRDDVNKAERAAASLEKQVNEHLLSTYHVWEQLTPQRRSELWGLELARGVGRRQKDVEKLRQSQYATKQENTNLKAQIEQLNRLQQPREFRLVPPATIPIEEPLLAYMLGMGAEGQIQVVGLNAEDRHVDLNTMVSRVIDRWKTVIVSSRTGGMTGQRSLGQTTPTTTPTSATSVPVPVQVPVPAPHLQSLGQQPQRQERRQRSLPSAASGASHESASSSSSSSFAANTAMEPSATNAENSDQDADAEMEEDDSFAAITPVAPEPPSRQETLEVARARANGQRVSGSTEARFGLNGAGTSRGPMMRPPIPNMNATPTMPGRAGHNQHGHLHGEYGAVVQGVGGGDAMYMD